MKMLINGEGKILGRLASYVAKELLKGNEIIIINPEKVMIIGNPEKVYEKYHHLKHEMATKSNPHKNKPVYFIRPDLFLKRVIRGMIPRYTKRGKESLKRLKIYLGDGSYIENIKNYETVDVPTKEVTTDYITIEELCKKLGWRGIE